MGHGDGSLIHFCIKRFGGYRNKLYFCKQQQDLTNMPMSTRKKSPTGICHVMLGQESKTSDSMVLQEEKIAKVFFDGGYVTATPLSSTTYGFTAYFYNKDHLGNNREVVTVGDNVQQLTNYYPFGAPYADPLAVMNASFQPYKYNGKELDTMHGLNTYDYGARQYNPITARWDRVDPLAEKYYNVSPYNYCHNNPLMLVDPDGMADYNVNSQGQMYESTSLWEKFKSFLGFGSNKDRIFEESTGKMLVQCDKGSITNLRTDNETKQTSFEVSGDKNANIIFDVLIKNTKVEWAQIDHTNQGKKNHTILTDHKIDDVSSAAQLLNQFEQRGEKSLFMKHSHPVSDFDLRGNLSDFINLDPSSADIKTAQAHPNVKFAVYNLYNYKIQYYNGKGIYKQESFK